ncbi:MAG: Ltp family lipoprotein [Coriobacteriia bacterium]
MTEPTPAGWYPDPENSGQQRYWDGNAWTENFAPGGAAAVPATPAAKKPIYKRAWFIVVAVLIGLGVIGNLIGGSPSETPESSPSATEGTPQPAETEVDPAVAEPEQEPEAEPEPEPAEEPAEPALTMGQQQAVGKGEDYLGFAAFSRQGLIDQLVYEGFSEADATFAVDYIAPDWNEQAAQKAQDYIDMSSFSRQGLIDQLVYEGFTAPQAEYGVTAVGY